MIFGLSLLFLFLIKLKQHSKYFDEYNFEIPYILVEDPPLFHKWNIFFPRNIVQCMQYELQNYNAPLLDTHNDYVILG